MPAKVSRVSCTYVLNYGAVHELGIGLGIPDETSQSAATIEL
jgi:hypothetical protein